MFNINANSFKINFNNIGFKLNKINHNKLYNGNVNCHGYDNNEYLNSLNANKKDNKLPVNDYLQKTIILKKTLIFLREIKIVNQDFLMIQGLIMKIILLLKI